MSGFDENGFCKPGRSGRAAHLGDPLTAEQIGGLPDGTEVVITWCGGNGPHPYRVLVDSAGGRRAESLYADVIGPLNRVTIGWDHETRAWHESKVPMPAHVQAEWARLRGTPATHPVKTDGKALTCAGNVPE